MTRITHDWYKTLHFMSYSGLNALLTSPTTHLLGWKFLPNWGFKASENQMTIQNRRCSEITSNIFPCHSVQPCCPKQLQNNWYNKGWQWNNYKDMIGTLSMPLYYVHIPLEDNRTICCEMFWDCSKLISDLTHESSEASESKTCRCMPCLRPFFCMRVCNQLLSCQ